jgi:hypothetical protein
MLFQNLASSYLGGHHAPSADLTTQAGSGQTGGRRGRGQGLCCSSPCRATGGRWGKSWVSMRNFS